MAEQSSADFRGTLGRYALFGEIAAGGMATVHLARLLGSVGFARTVAIKRLHPHLAKDPDFVAMFLEEARLAARVRHPNVVGTLDVVSDDNELFLVMEYIAGESLARLVKNARELEQPVPVRHIIGIVCSALEGLHAAHEATSERGTPLGIVHRDVSPQNIHVGLDGVARVLDFGIAKATNRVQETRTDQLKGKVAYMSPEQLAKGPIDRRADVYSASVLLWEALTGVRLFKADDVPSLVYSIMNDVVEPPSAHVRGLPPELDAIVMKGLDRQAVNRWSSARELAMALEKVHPAAPPREIGAWVKEVGGDSLAWRIELVHQIESETSSSLLPPLRSEPSASRDVTSGVVDHLGIPGRVDDEDEPDDERETLQRLATTDGAPASESRRRRWLWFAVLAAAIVVAFGGFLGVRLLQLQANEGTPTVSSEDPVESAEPAIGLGVARAASATASASASAVAPKPIRVDPKPEFSAPRAAPPPPTSECDNPFTVDAKGMRHPKPHCFRR